MAKPSRAYPTAGGATSSASWAARKGFVPGWTWRTGPVTGGHEFAQLSAGGIPHLRQNHRRRGLLLGLQRPRPAREWHDHQWLHTGCGRRSGPLTRNGRDSRLPPASMWGKVGWCRAPLMRNWRKVRRSNDRHARDWRGNRHQIPPCFYNVPAETMIALPFDPTPDTGASSVASRADPNWRLGSASPRATRARALPVVSEAGDSSSHRSTAGRPGSCRTRSGRTGRRTSWPGRRGRSCCAESCTPHPDRPCRRTW